MKAVTQVTILSRACIGYHVGKEGVVFGGSPEAIACPRWAHQAIARRRRCLVYRAQAVSAGWTMVGNAEDANAKVRADKSSKRQVEVRGNTLRVYLYLLKEGPTELRDVQRGLGLSTPSLASYHLERLSSLGYAGQNEKGQYYAVVESAGEILEGFTRVGGFLVPQLFFFAVLFTIVLLYFAYMSLVSVAYVPFLAAASIALVAVVWHQTLRVWGALTRSRKR
jgi:hypothetical protein